MKKLKKIRTFYFSPAGTTKAVAEYFTEALAKNLKLPFAVTSYTLPEERLSGYEFSDDELVVWASPVYAGRIPNKTLDFVKAAINGSSTLAIPIVVYGNRSFDNALSELIGIMKDNGCRPIAAAAIVARHSFSDTLAKGRPDEEDFALLDGLAEKAVEKLLYRETAGKLYCSDVADELCCSEARDCVSVPGQEHPEKYYVPLKEDLTPAKFLKAKPKVNRELCTGCSTCRAVCPMGSIAMEDGIPAFSGICIKCQACRRTCPNAAIYFDDAEFLSHVKMVEKNYGERKKSEIFV